MAILSALRIFNQLLGKVGAFSSQNSSVSVTGENDRYQLNRPGFAGGSNS
jgi:hypothetical protein